MDGMSVESSSGEFYTDDEGVEITEGQPARLKVCSTGCMEDA